MTRDHVIVQEGSGSNVSEKKRDRSDVPSSSLGTWKLNNSQRKEDIFNQPLLTGRIVSIFYLHIVVPLNCFQHVI